MVFIMRLFSFFYSFASCSNMRLRLSSFRAWNMPFWHLGFYWQLCYVVVGFSSYVTLCCSLAAFNIFLVQWLPLPGWFASLMFELQSDVYFISSLWSIILITQNYFSLNSNKFGVEERISIIQCLQKYWLLNVRMERK